jgi:hypothetical protein
MEMPDFSLLSLNDLIIPKLPEILQQQEYIDIMNCPTIKELFITLYVNEIPTITFEEMQQKLIQFYFEESSSNLISRHLDAIYNDLHESVIAHIHEKIMYLDGDIDQFNLNALIKFISISEGNEYLQDIYNMYCMSI